MGWAGQLAAAAVTASATAEATGTTGTKAGDLAAAAAGHEDEDRGVGGDAVGGAEAGGVAGVGAGFEDGVADELGGEAVAGEIGGFEGEQAEQAVPQSGEFLHAAFAPAPDLGGDVVGALEAEVFDAFQKAEGEAGAIDGDEYVRAVGGDVFGGGAEEGGEVAEFGQDFEQAHDGELAHGEERGEALGDHQRAADAGKFEVRAGGAEGVHEAGAEGVAALLAGDEVDQGHVKVTMRGAGGVAGQLRWLRTAPSRRTVSRRVESRSA